MFIYGIKTIIKAKFKKKIKTEVSNLKISVQFHIFIRCLNIEWLKSSTMKIGWVFNVESTLKYGLGFNAETSTLNS